MSDQSLLELAEHQLAAFTGHSGKAIADSHWPKPQAFCVTLEPEPYPLDALPDNIRAGVEEVVGFVKAPIPLVASSALSALSLACQAHIDVKRAEGLQGPLRKKDRLDAAIKELADLDRLRAQNEYSPATLAINPELLCSTDSAMAGVKR